MRKLFQDRFEAGRILADDLHKQQLVSPIVLAIPRGGVEVGRALADQLNYPLDLILCKKVGHPENPEVAIGSVCADGTTIQTMNPDTADPDYFNHQAAHLKTWLLGRYQQLTNREHPTDISGRDVILTDDGMATGSTMMSAIRSIRTAGANRVIAAVPVAPPSAYSYISKSADILICPIVESDFQGVGQFYVRFQQISDEQVKALFQGTYNTLNEPKIYA